MPRITDFKSVLSVVPNGLNRATTHRFVAERLFFVIFGLLVNKRIVVFVAAHEVVRSGVAADVTIDARRIHVVRTADVLFYFVVFVRHARFASGMRHLFRDHQLVKLFTSQKTEFHGRLAQADLLLVSVLCNPGSVVVTDVRIQCSHEHQGVL
jgi:hypothetical protein